MRSCDDDAVREYRGFGPALPVVVAVVVACTTGAGQAGSRDYPQWRGRDRDGSASGFVEPPSWPDVLTRRWRVQVGEGYASPLVMGDTVYVFARREGREVLTALDAESGAERWRSGYDAPYTPSAPTAVHGAGPKATPLFHDGTVITVGISGVVAAFDGTRGTILWRTSEPVEPPFFSAASSPIGAGRLVITHPGNYEPLTAFDASSGRTRWTAGGGGFFMSPALVVLDGTRQVVAVTQAAVVGVSIDDGRLLWEYPWAGGRAGGIMPVVAGDALVLSATTAGVVAIRPTLDRGRWRVDTLWDTQAVEMYISHPVVIGHTLFGFSRRASGQLFALDVRDGRVLWRGAPRFAGNVAFAKSGDLLFVLKDDAELVVARASASGFTPLKTYSVAESATWAQPVISGQRLFVKDVSTLALWTFD